MPTQTTYWHKPLTDPIDPTDGPLDKLVTVSDAARFVTELETWRQARPHWVHAGELILKAGNSGRAKDIDKATTHMRQALRVEGWL